MGKIFISYRRTDGADQAGRIFDRLVADFSRARVFKDVDSIPAGADFRRVIEEAVQKTEIVVLVIGPAWLETADDRGRRRLDDENDFVRLEIESALRGDKVIIPVLVRGATMPRTIDLPGSLREIAYRHAVSVRPDPDFHRDMDRLIQAIKARLAERPRTVRPSPSERPRRIRYGLTLIGVSVPAIVIAVQLSGPKTKMGEAPSPSVKAGFEPIGGQSGLPFPSVPSKVLPGDVPAPAPAADREAVASNSMMPSPQMPASEIPRYYPTPAPPAPAPAGDEVPPAPATMPDSPPKGPVYVAPAN